MSFRDWRVAVNDAVAKALEDNVPRNEIEAQFGRALDIQIRHKTEDTARALYATGAKVEPKER